MQVASMLPSDTSCGEEIKDAAKSGTCSASIFSLKLWTQGTQGVCVTGSA